MIVLFTNIDWDLTNDYDEDPEEFSPPTLPTKVLIHQDYFLKKIDSIEELEEYLDEYGADFLSDEFDFCINSFDFEIVEDRWQVNWMKDGCFEIYTKYEY
jgi:hypothetical protein